MVISVLYHKLLTNYILSLKCKTLKGTGSAYFILDAYKTLIPILVSQLVLNQYMVHD